MTTTPSPFQPLFQRIPATIYVNRQELLDDLVGKLHHSHFVAVSGRTGSGKTSLLSQGLIPALLDERANAAEWHIATTTPQLDPVRNLAAALARRRTPVDERRPEGAIVTEPNFEASIERQLREDSPGILHFFELEKSRIGRDFHLLIIIDQFEEMFRFRDLAADKTEARNQILRFVNLLTSAARNGIHVIVVIPTESMDLLAEYAGLAEMVNANRFTVPPIGIDDIKNALLAFAEKETSLFEGVKHQLSQLTGRLRTEPRPSPALAAEIDRQLDTIHDWIASADQGGGEAPGAPSLPAGIRNQLSAIHSREIYLLKDLLITGYEKLARERDPLALFKLHFALDYYREKLSGFRDLNALPALQAYAEALQGSVTEFQEKIFSLSGLVNFRAEQIFNSLTNAPGDERESRKKRCMRLFQALTETGSRREYFRRPVRAEELLLLANRAESANAIPSDADITAFRKSLIAPFNLNTEARINQLSEGEQDFFNIINPGAGGSSEQFSRHSIVDISNDALIGNWARLRKWAAMERDFGNVYQQLADDAIRFYLQPPETDARTPPVPPAPTPGTTSSSTWQGLLANMRRLLPARHTDEDTSEKPSSAGWYNDGNLAMAQWMWDNAAPTHTWAKRYFEPDLEQIRRDEPDQQRREELANLIKTRGADTFQLARQFYKGSLDRDRAEKERKERESREKLEAARRRMRWSVITAAVTSVLLIATIAFSIDARRKKEKLQVFDFLSVLLETNIIRSSASPPGRSNQLVSIDQVREQIKDKPGIRDPKKLIEQLEAANFLMFPPGDEAYRERSLEALLALGDLKTCEKAGRDFHESTSHVHALTDNTPRYPEVARFFQYPYLYHSLEEHKQAYFAKATGKRDSTLSHHALVTAFASNPGKGYEAQFAMGDGNGELVIFSEFPGKYSYLPPLPAGITALRYLENGRRLLAGTTSGQIFLYPNADSLRDEPNTPLPVFALPGGVRAIFPSARPDVVIVASHTGLFLLEWTGKAYAVRQQLPLQDILQSVSAIDINAGRDTLVVGGKDRTRLFSVDAARLRLDTIRTVSHPGIRITSIGISPHPGLHRIDHSGRRGTPLALGSETGDIWFMHLDELAKTSALNSEYTDRHYKYHTSTVTGLLFNDGLPQLASSSLDGAIRLWNLQQLDAPNGFDHNRLEDQKQGVWAIMYNNKDELLATENIRIRVWKTNIHALQQELKKWEREAQNK